MGVGFCTSKKGSTWGVVILFFGGGFISLCGIKVDFGMVYLVFPFPVIQRLGLDGWEEGEEKKRRRRRGEKEGKQGVL